MGHGNFFCRLFTLTALLLALTQCCSANDGIAFNPASQAKIPSQGTSSSSTQNQIILKRTEKYLKELGALFGFTKATSDPQKFDGASLYHQVREFLRDNDLSLNSKDLCKKWDSEWATKHTTDNVFDSEEETDKAIQEMIASLGERFTYYQGQKGAKQAKEQFAGEIAGIGAILQLKQYDDLIKALPENATMEMAENAMKVSAEHALEVREVIEGSPAEKAGVLAGDIIKKVNQQPTDGLTLTEVINRVRGKPNTKVTLTVERMVKGAAHTVTINLKRAVVIVKTVSCKEFPGDIAYIKLADFSSNHAEKQLSAAFSKVSTKSAVILDLRNNPGGRLECAMTLCQYLISDGTFLITQERQGYELLETRYVLMPHNTWVPQPDCTSPIRDALMVSTQRLGKNHPDSVAFKNREGMLLPAHTPLVVLINGYSASASEIVAGALKNRPHTIFVGERTLGKGVGQTAIFLAVGDDPAARELAVTSFEFLPGGSASDWVGIAPDIEVPAGNSKDDLQLNRAVNEAQRLILDNQSKQAKDAEIKEKRQHEFKKALAASKAKNEIKQSHNQPSASSTSPTVPASTTPHNK